MIENKSETLKKAETLKDRLEENKVKIERVNRAIDEIAHTLFYINEEKIEMEKDEIKAFLTFEEIASKQNEELDKALSKLNYIIEKL